MVHWVCKVRYDNVGWRDYSRCACGCLYNFHTHFILRASRYFWACPNLYIQWSIKSTLICICLALAEAVLRVSAMLLKLFITQALVITSVYGSVTCLHDESLTDHYSYSFKQIANRQSFQLKGFLLFCMAKYKIPWSVSRISAWTQGRCSTQWIFMLKINFRRTA